MNNVRKLMYGAVITGVLTTAAFADGHADPVIEGAIKARQAHMTLYSHNLGILGAMAQDKAPYDAEAAQSAATNLAALTTLAQASYWPQGSDNENAEKTRALPKIWEDFAGVSTIAMDLATASATLDAEAGNGLEALKAAFGPVGGACGQCHRAYRARN